MPSKANLTQIVSTSAQDISKVRVPSSTVPFEQMTISQLTQLRPGTNAEDSYAVNAVGDNVSVSTSSLLHQLGAAAAEQAVKSQVATSQIQAKNLATQVLTSVPEKIG
jgi:hypothetical protein